MRLACQFVLFQKILYFQLVGHQTKLTQLLSVMISEMIPGEVFPISMKPETTLVAVSMHKASTYFVVQKMVQF